MNRKTFRRDTLAQEVVNTCYKQSVTKNNCEPLIQSWPGVILEKNTNSYLNPDAGKTQVVQHATTTSILTSYC